MPALYNLVCDGLFPANCAIVGIAMDELTTEQFRGRMSEDIKKFSTRKEFDAKVWDDFVRRLYYTPGKFDDPAAFQRLSDLGILASRRVGNNVHYRLVDLCVRSLLDQGLCLVEEVSDRGWTRTGCSP